MKRRLGLDAAYERLVFLLATRRWRSRGQFDVHIDLDLHSYAAEERPDRMVWKSGGHIVDILLATYGQTARTHQGELSFTSEEEQATDAFCQTHGLTADFVAIEPNSKASWFGDLRAWPVERWQEVVDRIVSAGRYPIVQLGEQGGQALAQTIDLRGKLPVRLAMCLMKRARLFLGQEGGLMHVARALDVPSGIVWGGVQPGQWEAGYAYQRIQAAAVLAAANSDDWWFHAAARGHMASLAYMFDEIWGARVSGFSETRDGLDRRTHRLLVELQARW